MRLVGGGVGLVAPSVSLCFDRRDEADGFERAMVVEPRESLQRREFNRLA
jgi:hypothetical protein